MKQGRRIKTLHQLAAAATARRSVLTGRYHRRLPAAVVMNYQAAYVLRLLDEGICLNIPKKPIDLTKPPRKWIPRLPAEQSKPTLNLPYYPEIKP